jgi:fumarylacetoacetate (FAA) hydrolase
MPIANIDCGITQKLWVSWQDNKLHLPWLSQYNDGQFGKPHAGQDIRFNFAQLVAHAAKSCNLRAGAIIGSGVRCPISKVLNTVAR